VFGKKRTQSPTPFKRQRRDVGRVIPEAFSYNLSVVPFAPGFLGNDRKIVSK
jgi:hypothetical protein